MKVNLVEYVIKDDQPYAILSIEEKKAIIGDIKKPILDQGYVYLMTPEKSENWESILPVCTIYDERRKKAIKAKGFTSDSTIIKIAVQFWNDSSDMKSFKQKINKPFIPSNEL